MENQKEMTNEDLAFIVKLLWESLIVPSWGYQDLVEFGKLVYSKTKLKDIPSDKFEKLLPFLTAMSKNLGTQLLAKIEGTVDPLIKELADVSSKYNTAMLEIEALKKQIAAVPTNDEGQPCQTA